MIHLTINIGCTLAMASWLWTAVPRGCDGVRIDNIKLVSARVENGDGFDPVNSSNITLRDSFIRTDDDCIAPKGMGANWQEYYRPEYGSAWKPAGKLAPGAEKRRHAPIVLIEARQSRGVIAVKGGADGPFKAAVARLQDGLKRATGTTLPVVEEAKPGPAVILGDSPQAAAEGLKSDQVPAGGYEIRTLKERVLLVGDPAGVLRSVDAFLARALHYVPQGSTEPGTDLVAPPMAASNRRE